MSPSSLLPQAPLQDPRHQSAQGARECSRKTGKLLEGSRGPGPVPGSFCRSRRDTRTRVSGRWLGPWPGGAAALSGDGPHCQAPQPPRVEGLSCAGEQEQVRDARSEVCGDHGPGGGGWGRRLARPCHSTQRSATLGTATGATPRCGWGHAENQTMMTVRLTSCGPFPSCRTPTSQFREEAVDGLQHEKRERQAQSGPRRREGESGKGTAKRGQVAGLLHLLTAISKRKENVTVRGLVSIYPHNSLRW